MESHRVLTLALGLAVLVAPNADAKVVEGSLQLSSEDTEQYITKFAFQEGASGTVEGKLTHEGVYLDNHPHFLEFYLFTDTEWVEYRQMIEGGSLCKDRVRLPSHTVKIQASPDEGGQHVMKFMTPVETPSRVRYYYAVIGDCYLEEYDAHPPRIHYELQFLNGKMIFPGDSPDQAKHDESELPADEQGMYAMNSLILVPMTAYLGLFAYLTLKMKKEKGQVHLVVVILGAAYLLQMGSVFFEWCHLAVYRSNGKGLRWRHSFLPADFISEACQGLSELLISFLLVALACGWTLSDMMFADCDLDVGASDANRLAKFLAAFSRPAELVKKVTPASVFAAVLFSLQVLLELAGRAYEDDFNQFHDMEHLPGHLLQLLRVVLCGVFWAGLRHSMKHNYNGEVSTFLKQLLVLGTVWYLAFPVLVFVASTISPHLRHRFVTVGSIVCQTVAVALLSYLFLGPSGYKKVSSLSRMSAGGSSFSSLGAGGTISIGTTKVNTD
eukprot:g1275.t1